MTEQKTYVYTEASWEGKLESGSPSPKIGEGVGEVFDPLREEGLQFKGTHLLNRENSRRLF